MLTAKVLNNQASLNNFKEINGIDFMLGNSFILNFRLIDPQYCDRYVPPSTAIVKLTFNNMDTTTFTKTATFTDVGDRSLMSVSLLTGDTSQLLGGNIPFTVDVLGDGSQILYGIIYTAIRKVAVSWGPND